MAAFSEAKEWWDSDLQRVVKKAELEQEQELTRTPLSPASPEDSARRECSRSLCVRPARLHALLLYSQTPGGGTDWASRHAGCPVGLGEVKWLANVWLWNGESVSA